MQIKTYLDIKIILMKHYAITSSYTRCQKQQEERKQTTPTWHKIVISNDNPKINR